MVLRDGLLHVIGDETETENMMATFRLVLEEAELDYIGKVLSQRPYAEVVVLMGKLQQQVSQQQASEAPKGPEGMQPPGPNGSEPPAAYTAG